MRSLLTHWSRQLSDSGICIPPWPLLRHRRRSRAASRPHAMTLGHCGALHSGSALAAGVLLAWLVSVPGTMAAQAVPSPTHAEAAPAVATAPQVTVEQATFGPATLTIPVGTTVTWVNNDSDLHTVTSTQGLFASPGLDSGDHFAYRFTAPGTYPYFCALHPHMKGTIIVQ
jgi:plastocyanin